MGNFKIEMPKKIKREYRCDGEAIQWEELSSVFPNRLVSDAGSLELVDGFKAWARVYGVNVHLCAKENGGGNYVSVSGNERRVNGVSKEIKKRFPQLTELVKD
jgi:hypothetical protein|tara:strand:+ start:319 stop:627 length:309 start_codon:yes stop_codon:yes gene_type:complete